MHRNAKPTSVGHRDLLDSLVIIDVSYLAHRAKWSVGDMSYNGRPTGVLYGMLLQLGRLQRLFPAEAVYTFAWDSAVSLRRKILPEYKRSRQKEPTPEDEKIQHEFYQQINMLRSEILEPIGFYNHIMRRGYEADDAIASIVNWWTQNRKGSVWIVSSDDDLFQLLDKAEMYRPHINRNYTQSQFRLDYGIEPADWIEVTAIAGTHNEVPGVYGVGVKTAIRYFLGEPVPAKKKEAIAQAYADGLIDRNRELIRLPYRNANLIPSNFDPKSYRVDERGWDEVQRAFGFASLSIETKR